MSSVRGLKPEVYSTLGQISALDSLKAKCKEIDQWYLPFTFRPTNKNKQVSTVVLYNQSRKQDYYSLVSHYENKPLLKELDIELKECYDVIEKFLKTGEPKSVVLIYMPAGSSVKEHTDQGYHIKSGHRFMVPVISDKSVIYNTLKGQIPSDEGFIYEVNSTIPHSIESGINSIHLMIDWNEKNDPFYQTNEI